MNAIELSELKQVIESIRSISNKHHEENELQQKIQAIKQATEHEWGERYFPIIQKLNNHLRYGIPVPVLTVCGRGTQEIRFTKYLHYMLDQDNLHGLHELLLKELFQEYADEHKLSPDWIQSATVESEVLLGSYEEKSYRIHTYCDIVITGKDYAIFLEQKTISGESIHQHTDKKQLERYADCLSKNPRWMGKKHIKIFLTPKDAAGRSSLEWIPLSQEDVVRKALRLYQKPDLSETAKHNLSRFLLDLVMGPYGRDETLLKEITSLASQLNQNYNAFQATQFTQLIRQHELLIRILLEGDQTYEII